MTNISQWYNKGASLFSTHRTMIPSIVRVAQDFVGRHGEHNGADKSLIVDLVLLPIAGHIAKSARASVIANVSQQTRVLAPELSTAASAPYPADIPGMHVAISQLNSDLQAAGLR